MHPVAPPDPDGRGAVPDAARRASATGATGGTGRVRRRLGTRRHGGLLTPEPRKAGNVTATHPDPACDHTIMDSAEDVDPASRAVASSDVRVVPAREHDLGRTAELHVTELHHGLFPRLGQGFVGRWHRVHHYSAYGVVLVALRAGEVVGFLLGTTDQRRHVSWTIRHHRRELVVAAIRAMLARPGVMVDFLRTRALRYAARLTGRDRHDRTVHATATTTAGGDGPVAVLEAVVVAPAAQGAGAGRALVDRFLTIVARAGVRRVDLVTKAGPSGAAGFYERSGWQQVGAHEDRDGDMVLTFRIDPGPWLPREACGPDGTASSTRAVTGSTGTFGA